MADEDANSANGQQIFDRTDEFTASLVGLAARTGEEATLQKLLTEGAPFDVSDNRGWFPLHEAAAAGQDGCLRSLLLHGSKSMLNSQAYNGETPAFLAAINGNIKCVKTLLEFGADINVLNHEEVSLLGAAVSSGKIECVKIFLDCNLDINSQDVGGWSALHEAAFADQKDIIALLLSHGANINIQNSDGATPLFTAAQYGNQSCMNLLLEKGTDINILTIDGASPLFIAAQEGFSESVKTLLDAGANPECSVTGGATPLHTAAEQGHEDCIKILLDAGVNPRAETDPDKITPVHLSSQEGHYSCLQLLLSAGAKADTPTVGGNMTPICLACQGYADCTKLLLDWGANPNHIYEDVDVLPKTPLMVAVEGDYADCAKILAEHGVDTDKSTYTSPLILAAQNSSIDCCKILLDFGADVNFIDRGKNSALSIAVTRYCLGMTHKRPGEQLNCVRLLLKRGASVEYLHEEACDLFKDCYVVKRQSPELFELLLEFEGNRPLTREICRINSIFRENRETKWHKLLEITGSPRSLQHSCRLVIRHYIKSSRIQRISELPLPQPLRQFLAHADL